MAVTVDKTFRATALAFDENAYDPHDKKGLPVPIHQTVFDCDVTGLGHIAVANRLEKLFFEMVGIDHLSGIRKA